MKIAMVAPIYLKIPPSKYGGIERIVFDLTEELVKRGHRVTLFASGDSKTSAKLISTVPRAAGRAALEDFLGLEILTNLNLNEAYKRHTEFDVIHNHPGHFSIPAGDLCPTPTVETVHGPILRETRQNYLEYKKILLAAISYSQAEKLKECNLGGVVHNGFNFDNFPMQKKRGNYLLYVGRINKDKGAHLAVRIAAKLRMPLIIAAKLDPDLKPFFNKTVRPFLSRKIRWIGEVTTSQRNKLYAGAFCFINPITWDEPFGMTAVEAQACGCPVVAFNKGAMRETIKNNQTGFVINSYQNFLQAVKKTPQIDSTNCRRHALSRFSATRMAEDYEKLYEKAIKGWNK